MQKQACSTFSVKRNVQCKNKIAFSSEISHVKTNFLSQSGRYVMFHVKTDFLSQSGSYVMLHVEQISSPNQEVM